MPSSWVSQRSPAPATLHQVSQLRVIKGATATAEDGARQLMASALPLLIAPRCHGESTMVAERHPEG